MSTIKPIILTTRPMTFMRGSLSICGNSDANGHLLPSHSRRGSGTLNSIKYRDTVAAIARQSDIYASPCVCVPSSIFSHFVSPSNGLVKNLNISTVFCL